MDQTKQEGRAVDYHIGCDWLSYTRGVYPDPDATELDFFNSIKESFIPEPYSGSPPVHKLFLTSEQQIGRSPYSTSFLFDKGGRLYCNPKLPHALMEISGNACMEARRLGVLDSLIEFAFPRITRIDIAVDIRTDVLPIEVVSEGISARFKSLSHVVSETGSTVYIGSRASDKFLRVYRYAPPHPRSELLRFEFVFKKKQSVAVASALINSGFNYRGIAENARQQYGLETAIWPRSSDIVDVDMQYDQRTQGKTLIWLIKTAAPAFQKLVNNGLIADPNEFLSDYFLKGL